MPVLCGVLQDTWCTASWSWMDIFHLWCYL